MIRWIAFDADDTLWENEIYYQQAQQALCLALNDYCPAEQVMAALLNTEIANLPSFGYGIKSFGLSMIETAIDLSGGAIAPRQIATIIKQLKQMANHPPQVLPGVRETLDQLKPDYQLMVITKGDLLDQERKLLSSGLADVFEAFEVVHTKDENSYRLLLRRHDIPLANFMMVGNSLKSDVLPVTALGATGVFLPHSLTWEHEKIDGSMASDPPYYEIASIKALPALLAEIHLREK